MTLKLLFDPQTGRVLGAQAVGGAGVDKRIDVLAVAIQAGMTVFDLEEMELAYAPQYGSAKDPINMAGFVARRTAARRPSPGRRGSRPGRSARRASFPLRRAHAAGICRRAYSGRREHSGGRVAVRAWATFPRDREIAVYCQVGQRGYLATRILRQAGFPPSISAAATRHIDCFFRSEVGDGSTLGDHGRAR